MVRAVFACFRLLSFFVFLFSVADYFFFCLHLFVFVVEQAPKKGGAGGSLMGKFISGAGKKERGFGGDDHEDSPTNGAAVSFRMTVGGRG